MSGELKSEFNFEFSEFEEDAASNKFSAWLYYMFSAKPYTYETGEDMHLCFTCKLYGNISCYGSSNIWYFRISKYN